MHALFNFAYNTQKDTQDLKASLLQNVRKITKMH